MLELQNISLTVSDDIDEKTYIDNVLKIATRSHDDSVSGRRINVILGEMIFQKIKETIKLQSDKES